MYKDMHTYVHWYTNACMPTLIHVYAWNYFKRQATIMVWKTNKEPIDLRMRTAARLLSEKTFHILTLSFANLCDNVLSRYYRPLFFYRQRRQRWSWLIFIFFGHQYGAHPGCCIFPKVSFGQCAIRLSSQTVIYEAERSFCEVSM